MFSKRCLICKPKNDTLYHHIDPETASIWMYCNKCDRGYSLHDYCNKAGISLSDYLKNDIQFIEARPNEVNSMEWPRKFVSILDERAKHGAEYLKSRGLNLDHNFYYDLEEEGIVFPYYFDNTFCGAQVRFVTPRMTKDGPWKITTLPGTRLGLLIYNFNQTKIMPNVKAFVVTEGAFNALSIQQALNTLYGSLYDNPYRCVACSGSGASKHQLSVFKDMIDRGYKVICSSDNDEAGMKMFKKYVEAGSATHYSITATEKDWNDELISRGDVGLAKEFLARMKDI